ncbi:ferrous iron transport protein B [Enhydrobacter aerosaccus]|uniref:Ferrous iron transport protein B n=1 Tax=Enhydrobacter aerosaccus TaxID=225324 RepID=A0A1T4NI00_9HYPH|nr:ferrous iron transport protein B [Enhydrobacter aerosaccus]SJZ78398.1 ferrous iron transport protein B [Enhydrobacter aerosaccus]
MNGDISVAPLPRAEQAPESTAAAAIVALVGNPNCGKTALFNALTGSRQKVANYPGVTVEKKTGQFTTPAGRAIKVVDLPGTYSLRARSPDEEITRDAVLGRLATEAVPDLIVCVADASNLRLALRLVLELKHVGRPLLLSLNMMDIARKRGIEIDIDRLSAALGIPVVSSVAVRRGGTDGLLAELDRALDRRLQAGVSDWHAPNASELRSGQREADRLLRLAVRSEGRLDPGTAKADALLLHPVAGLVILLAILFVMFQAVFAWARPLMDAISDGFTWFGALVGEAPLPEILRSFLKDGVIAGVGSVIVFLPQITILFFFILLLEDLGYMARAAFLMDKIMGGAGLHGRAFIPLLSSFACAIPGIMATRVIDDRRDRLTTILVAPLMTCSARIPVYTLIISAFIPDRQVWGVVGLQGLVMFGLYAVGIVGALVVSFIAKRLFWRTNAGEPFMLELPDYKIPQLKSLLLGVWARALAFLKRAGTTILSMMILIWVLASFPQPPDGATGPAINYSLAAMIGNAIAPLTHPLGFNWQINVALVPGMAAREVAVGALGTIYSIDGGESAADKIGQVLSGQWSLATALAFLAWYIFAPQCASTLAVIRRETGSWKWMAVTFFYMLALAYAAAFAVFQVASALGAG